MISRELVAASSIPLVLSILSLGESYGYAIIKTVRRITSEEMQWTEGMLYPVLHRLERQKLIESYWHIGESGRRRKYYRLTLKGTDELNRLKSQWEFVDTILRSAWEDNIHPPDRIENEGDV